jgi:hypothetical protein
MLLVRGAPAIAATLLDARDAFAAVLPHACTFSMTDAVRRRQMVEQYLTLAARVPVFRLAYPTDFGALPEVMEAVASTVGRRAAVG